MKTNRILPAMLRSSTLALTGAAFATLAFISAANAQFKPVSDDGIAASPKVRQVLNEKKLSAKPTTIAAPIMACPKCAEILTSHSSRQAKGAEILFGVKTTSVKHACSGCEVKWTVVGEGKARHSVAAHSCSADVQNNNTCCAN